MEFVLCGIPLIDIKEWFNNTKYKGNYSNSHKVIIWFWEILDTINPNDLYKFFRFCTGFAGVPICGFKNINYFKFYINSINFNGKENIQIHCYNEIDLPIFQTKEQVENSIKNIINNFLFE